MSVNPTADQSPTDELAKVTGSIFGGIIVSISLLTMGLFLFSLLGRFFFLAELLGNFRAQILILLAPCAMLAILFQRWFVGLLAVSCTLWCSTGVLSVYLPTAQPPAGQQSIRVMSFNVLARNIAYENVKQQIVEVDPDVALIVECDHQWHTELQTLVDDGIYPYHLRVPRWHGFGIAVFSKLPLSNKKVFQLTADKTDVPLALCDIAVGDQIIRLAGMHAISPTSRYRMSLRNQQFQEAAKILRQRDVPTVVAGDFNCTPWSPFLHEFLSVTGCRDSRQGFGYQGTWNAKYRWLAMIPIDHAFVSPDIRVNQRYVCDATTSDHYPIVFEISVRPLTSATAP